MTPPFKEIRSCHQEFHSRGSVHRSCPSNKFTLKSPG